METMVESYECMYIFIESNTYCSQYNLPFKKWSRDECYKDINSKEEDANENQTTNKERNYTSNDNHVTNIDYVIADIATNSRYKIYYNEIVILR